MQEKNTKRARDGRKAAQSEVPKEGSSKVDELGIQRGQNGEKGYTVRPENLRDVKEASH